MEKLTTPKEVFTYIIDEKGFLERKGFICLCIQDLWFNCTINTELEEQCLMIINKNKPQNDSFTKFDYWCGGHSWWLVLLAELVGEEKELYQEKRRFLTHLIDKL